MGTTERKTDTVRGRLAPRRPHVVVRAGVALTVAALIGSTALVAPAAADPLDAKHDRLQDQISQTKQDMSESSAQASAAAVALTRAQHALTTAQAALEKTQQEVAAAKAKDLALAEKLREQRAALAKAKAAVQAGLKKIADQKALVGSIVRNQFQRQSSLMPLAMLTSATSMSDLEKRAQLSRTMLDTNQSEFNDLTELQKQLTAEKARQAELEKQVAAAKAESARNLETKRELEQRAATQRAEVATLVTQRQAAEAAAKKAVAADEARYSELQREDAAVQKRIAERIARERAAAARRAAAAKRQAEADAAAARARSRSRSNNSGSSGGSSYTASSSSAHHGFIYPVNGPITSPYGMRLHPVLHVWKLHDGTDFGAGCGTPIHAPYSGRVAERYFNAGYGNRLIIDHGMVDGHYITTAMNHAIRYTVGVGEHVSKGEVIGYVGETGYATGCHMHLMVWKDGTMINPMTWY